MNKRIKKKKAKQIEAYLYGNTQKIVIDAFHDYIDYCPIDFEKGYKQYLGSVRYRTYLKKYKIRKKDTGLGSKITKYVDFFRV